MRHANILGVSRSPSICKRNLADHCSPAEKSTLWACSLKGQDAGCLHERDFTAFPYCRRPHNAVGQCLNWQTCAPSPRRWRRPASPWHSHPSLGSHRALHSHRCACIHPLPAHTWYNSSLRGALSFLLLDLGVDIQAWADVMRSAHSGASRPPLPVSYPSRSYWSWDTLMHMQQQLCKGTSNIHDVLLQVNLSNQLKRKAEEDMHAYKAEKVPRTKAARGASPQSQAAAGPTAKGSTAAVGGSMRR